MALSPPQCKHVWGTYLLDNPHLRNKGGFPNTSHTCVMFERTTKSVRADHGAEGEPGEPSLEEPDDEVEEAGGAAEEEPACLGTRRAQSVHDVGVSPAGRQRDTDAAHGQPQIVAPLFGVHSWTFPPLAIFTFAQGGNEVGAVMSADVKDA